MATMEIRPSEGGADATTFAGELATAIAKHAGTSVRADGTALVLDRL